MGEVRVDKVTVDSHLHTEEMLKAILEQEPVNIHFVTDGGNGAEVDLTLHPDTHKGDLMNLLLSEEIQIRLNAIGLEIKMAGE